METSFGWVVNTCVSVTDKKNIQKYGNLSIESLEQCQIIIWGGGGIPQVYEVSACRADVMIYCNLFGWINLKEPFYRARFGRDYLLWNLAFGKLSNHSIFLCKIWRLINYFKYWVIDYLNWEKNYLMHNISKWSGTLWKFAAVAECNCSIMNGRATAGPKIFPLCNSSTFLRCLYDHAGAVFLK